MKTVYVAGPYRGKTPWDVEQNIRNAEKLAFRVASAGLVPVCPHSMYRYFDKTCTDTFWLEATLELLRRCDALMLEARWLQSSGSIGEYKLAVETGIPVFQDVCWDREFVTQDERFVIPGWRAFEKWAETDGE